MFFFFCELLGYHKTQSILITISTSHHYALSSGYVSFLINFCPGYYLTNVLHWFKTLQQCGLYANL